MITQTSELHKAPTSGLGQLKIDIYTNFALPELFIGQLSLLKTAAGPGVNVSLFPHGKAQLTGIVALFPV